MNTEIDTHTFIRLVIHHSLGKEARFTNFQSANWPNKHTSQNMHRFLKKKKPSSITFLFLCVLTITFIDDTTFAF